MDATRLSDGIHVTLKTVDTSVHPFEVEIAQFLSSGQVAHDPRNHCVPILDVLQDPVEPNTAILVMPLLMSFQLAVRRFGEQQLHIGHYHGRS